MEGRIAPEGSDGALGTGSAFSGMGLFSSVGFLSGGMIPDACWDTGL